MKSAFTLILIFFLTPPVFADESCQAQAAEIAKRISYADPKSLKESKLSLDDFDDLKKLNEKHCFDYETLITYDGHTLTYLYFDPKTMDPIGKQANIRQAVIARDNKTVEFIQRIADKDEAKIYLAANSKIKRASSDLDRAGPTDEAKAAACKDNGDGIIKALPPIRNQGGAGYCSFFGMADALSVALKTNISAAYLGAVISPKDNHGGLTESFNELISKFGLCREQTMPSNNLPEKDGSYASFADSVDIAFGDAVASNNSRLCNQAKMITTMFPGRNLKSLMDIARKITDADGGIEDTGMTRLDFDHIQSKKRIPVEPSYISHFALEQCADDRKKLSRNVKVVQEYVSGDFEKGFKAINDLLSAGKPAVIGYDFYKLLGGKGGGHVSSIVERRYINGHCQFLIRNSWGKSSCTRAASEKDACGKPGYFWVDALNLLGAVHSVSHVE